MLFSLLLWACEPNYKSSVVEDDSAAMMDSGDDVPIDSGGSEATPMVLVTEVAPGALSGTLSLHDLNDWQNETFVDTTSQQAHLVESGGAIWLLETGMPDRISQYDPSDFFAEPTRYEIPLGSSGSPKDVSHCGDNVFVTLYDATEILVLNPADLTETARIDISSYADDDGLPEASTMVCKDNTLIVSLHRFNRNENPNTGTPQQMGSMWLFVDVVSFEVIKTKEEIGYLCEIEDIADTDLISLVIHPHIDVSGTTGFWTYDLNENVYYSQVYAAFNDMAINAFAFDDSNAVHIARSWYDDSSMAFCHPFTPGADLPNNMSPVNAPQSVNYQTVFMDDQGFAWISYERLMDEGTTVEYGLFPVDPERCQLNTNEVETPKQVKSAIFITL